MGRKKDQDDVVGGVRFELEDDAEELMEAFLRADQGVPDKAADEQGEERSPDARRPRARALRIDLHGLTLAEAQREVVAQIDQALQQAVGSLDCTIITGKGRHSGAQGGVLVRQMYDFVRQRYAGSILRIDADPVDTLVDGIPLRGHFNLKLRK